MYNIHFYIVMYLNTLQNCMHVSLTFMKTLHTMFIGSSGVGGCRVKSTFPVLLQHNSFVKFAILSDSVHFLRFAV